MIKKILRKIKTNSSILLGLKSYLKKEIEINAVWYGSEYGGFYCNPDHLSDISIIYSFGVGEDISFEEEIINKHNCKVFSFDPTPKSIEWIKNQQLPQNLTFLNYGLDSKTGFVDFNLPKNKDYISGSIINYKNVDSKSVISVPVKCLEDITKELGHDHIDVLKIDIEGSEFEVIGNIFPATVLIKQVLLEIHERFFVDGRSKVKKLLKVMKENGYDVFAVSDSLSEISFIKNKNK